MGMDVGDEIRRETERLRPSAAHGQLIGRNGSSARLDLAGQSPCDDLVAIEVTEPSAADFKPPVPLSEPPDNGELPGDAPAPS